MSLCSRALAGLPEEVQQLQWACHQSVRRAVGICRQSAMQRPGHGCCAPIGCGDGQQQVAGAMGCGDLAGQLDALSSNGKARAVHLQAGAGQLDAERLGCRAAASHLQPLQRGGQLCERSRAQCAPAALVPRQEKARPRPRPSPTATPPAGPRGPSASWGHPPARQWAGRLAPSPAHRHLSAVKLLLAERGAFRQGRLTCRAQDRAALGPSRRVTALAEMAPHSEGGGVAVSTDHLHAGQAWRFEGSAPHAHSLAACLRAAGTSSGQRHAPVWLQRQALGGALPWRVAGGRG